MTNLISALLPPSNLGPSIASANDLPGPSSAFPSLIRRLARKQSQTLEYARSVLSVARLEYYSTSLKTLGQ
ncbi:hypothetical protein LZ32DRAFT_605594 [Colletotrichum eremochloae]|nr:hypothetical protein LZ32DRAFT_605594 [Colletotrichum eremochloae]